MRYDTQCMCVLIYMCMYMYVHCSLSLSIQVGDTPLMTASSSGHTDVVCVLIEEGHAHVNTQNMVRMLSQR